MSIFNFRRKRKPQPGDLTHETLDAYLSKLYLWTASGPGASGQAVRFVNHREPYKAQVEGKGNTLLEAVNEAKHRADLLEAAGK